MPNQIRSNADLNKILKENPPISTIDNSIYSKQLLRVRTTRNNILLKNSSTVQHDSVKLKGSTPRITQGDLRQHIKDHPLSVAERAQYLIKSNQKNGKLSKDVLKKLGHGDPELTEMMQEVYQLINIKKSCKQLVDKCAEEQDECKKHIKNMNLQLT